MGEGTFFVQGFSADRIMCGKGGEEILQEHSEITKQIVN